MKVAKRLVDRPGVLRVLDSLQLQKEVRIERRKTRIPVWLNEASASSRTGAEDEDRHELRRRYLP
jgi:hypothetical protein